MICPACKGIPHNGRPPNCPGGTWCDCQCRAGINPETPKKEPEPGEENGN